MFTGLVEEVGRVVQLVHAGGAVQQDAGGDVGSLRVACEVVRDGTRIGDSIAVDGVCLTVTSIHDDGLPDDGVTFEVMGETFARSTTGGLAVGDGVNLERAMLAGGRLGGHLVQGHVDGVAAIRRIDPQGQWTTVTYELPAALAPYVALKGSITIDGTSLTVMDVDDDSFSVGLIPHTLAVTTHGARSVGDRVNLEVDIIAKYVERQLAGGVTSPYTPDPSESPVA